MDWETLFLGVAIGCLVGLIIGKQSEAALWRGKGDHPYMNRMESWGRLYFVKNEDDLPHQTERSSE
jgi:hypothetical protein